MKITNKHKLPLEYVRAVQADIQERDYYSPSLLEKGPREVHLTRRHFAEISIDAVDRLWALFGTAVHHVMENNAGEGEAEKELTGNFYGYNLQGKSDLITKDGIIRDWKVTSSWTVVFQSYEKYYLQANAYKRLFEKNGYTVRGMELVLILRDWSKNKAGRDKDYPQIPIITIGVPVIYDIDEIIADRLDALHDTENWADEDLPPCTPEQRWQTETKYAVKREGRKSAIRVYDDKEEAEARAVKEKGYVEVREGEPRKCAEYCLAAPFCTQYKEWQDEKNRL
jgi:hypothetical protein